MNKNNREFESLYIQKLKSLPVLAKIYIYLRKYFVNPIQLSKSKAKLLQIIR
jgi:hypothetical protein